MSIEEKRRADFEKWYWKEFWSAHAHESENIFNRYGGVGGYRKSDVQRQWVGWNAALDSVEIELPQPWTEAFMKSESMLNDCKFAIESAGLKVKP